MAAKQETAEREAAERVANARADQTKQLGETEARNVEAETKRKAAALRAEAEFADAAAERERLKKLAQRPDIQFKYRPFLEKGRFRPTEDARDNRTETLRPMSYTDLKRFGVLNDYKSFAKAGGCGHWGRYQQINDRPIWPCPQREDEFDKYRALFQEFVQLAPIWAETGVLDP